jgi:hypothetical protein
MSENSTPHESSLSRVWLIDGRARADHVPEFMYFLKLDTIDQSFGSVNKIEQPSKSQYGAFDQVGEFRDASERPTSSLMGHYALDVKSRLLTLAKGGCQFDVQAHLGKCEDPGNFNDFQKAIIFEGVIIEDYSTDSVGALESGDRGKVDETGDFSSILMYEFVPLAFAARSPSGVTNEVLDVTVCDNPSCGDCASESNGCQTVVAITKAAGGSPSTPADIVYTIDGGLNWFVHDIDTIGVATDPSAVACVGNYVVVVANTNGDEMHIALISELDGVTDPAFTQITTGFVAGGAPNDISSIGNIAYLCGNGGYIYKTTNAAAGVSVIDAGVATTSVLNAIDMLSETFGVAVGNDGTVVLIQNDLASALSTQPVGIGVNLQAVAVKSDTEFFVGDDNGDLWHTIDAGSTWTEIILPGGNPTAITDIAFASNSVLYVSGTLNGKGEIWISINGGYDFERAPRGQAGAFPANDRVNAIAACEFDVDFVVGVGLADDGADGFIVVGSD